MNGSRERDQSVERLLRQSLQTPRADGVTDSCLDAETLAAWTDGGLSGAALEVAQFHVADCARCQALVGTLMRINVVVPPVEPERASRWWLAWVAPLTAAAAALALWVAVPRDTGTSSPQAADVQRQGAATKAQTPASLDRTEARASEPAREKEEPAETKEAAGSNQPRAQTPEVRRDDARLDTRLEAENLRPRQGLSGAIVPSAPALAAPPPPAASALAAPVAPAAAARLLAEKSVGVAADAAAVLAPIEIASSDASVRWRIAGSVVQRSTDGGSRWDDVPTGLAVELTAGAAPSASVCWVVGRGGLVLLSADGRTWRRVAFPEAADLSAVRATDARTASVSTADGRPFSTTDAGATWVSR